MPFIRYATLCLLLFFFAACNRNAVELSDTNAKGEVETLGNLEFRFSKALFPDSLVNQWDSTEYVDFDPAIKGRFRWEGPDKLIFSPSEPLPPATAFTARFSSELFRYSEYNKVEGADALQFYTSVAKLEQSYVSWSVADGAAPAPVLQLVFNHPVEAEKLKDLVEIRTEERSRPFMMVSAGASTRVQLKLTDVPLEDKETPLSVKVSGNLVPERGRNAAGEDMVSDLTIPSPYQVEVINVSATHTGSMASVEIRTTQALAEADMKEFIKTDPALPWNFTLMENGVLMTAENVETDQTYELTIRKGLKGKIGGALKADYTQQLGFGEMQPSVQFTNSKGMYLSRLGAQNLEMQLVNVPKVKIIVSKIYESNLLAAQRYGYYPKETGGAEDDYYYYEGSSDLNLGDVIYEKEVDAASLPKYGNSRLLSFNLEDKLKDFNGIYHVMVRSTEKYWVRDSRFVALSDLGLIAKEGKDEMMVFVQSIQKAEPVNEAQLTLYGSNNQVIGVGSTDADGVGRIKYIRREPTGFQPALLSVKTASDFNYLPFHSTRVNTSRFETGGKKMHAAGLDAFVFAERDMYRPGETFRYGLILRTPDWKVSADMPLKLKFVMPNGKEWTTLRKNTNDQGVLDGTLNVPGSALTGTYNMEVYTGNNLLLATYPFQVEEFVPDRLKVQASTGLTSLKPGQEAKLSIQADYFFGSPAANRNWATEIQLKQQTFQSKKYSGYSFTLDGLNGFFDNKVEEGKTDANGAASLNYKVPQEYKNRGLLQAAFYATVFDEAGRPVSRHHTLPVYTQDVFIGVGADGYGYYPLRQSVKFPLIALDKNGVLANGAKAIIKVVKKNYKTVLTRSGGYFRYESQREDKILQEKEIAVSGENAFFSFVPQESGSYELRAYLPGASVYVSKSFYSYGSWGIEGGSFDVNTDGNIDISTDRASYQPGEKAKILFKAPFDGKLLVTLENNGVLSHTYLDVVKRTATWECTLAAEHLPNVFITATLIKPHQQADIPLTVAHGFQSVRVEASDRKIPVKITAANASRSRKKQTVSVKAVPGAYVSIAAVDNGILQVSDFKTPDPYAYFYQNRALGVNAFDLYPFLLPELRQRLSSTGGDAGLSMEKRINPITNKRFKLVSFWSGFRKADASGQVQFELDIPAFSGEIRVMTVALKDDRFGAAESVMKVADPLVISTAMPRFLSPGDTLQVPVTVMNTTGRGASVSATMQVKGPLKVVGSATLESSAAANGEGRMVYKLVADNKTGAAQVLVSVKGLGETFTEEVDITVRPASTLQTRSGSGVMAAGGKADIRLPIQDFMPGSVQYELATGASPLLEYGPQLNNLLQYPYGCTEQTIAAAFPQLYFSELTNAISAGKNKTAAANIQEAIRKIKARQLYNGAVMMWDGYGQENWWATAFAAHFLIEAGKAGYTVENNLIDPMMNYLQFRLRNRELVSYTYNRTENKKIAPKEVAYSLFVLSLAGKPQASAMNYYKAHPEWLSIDSKYMLAAAFALAGDRRKVPEVLPASYSGEVSEKQTGGSFYSPIRDEAIALLMLAETDTKHAQIPMLVKRVAAALKQNRWLNTQELVFSTLALGKLAAASGQASLKGSIVVNGKNVAGLTEKSQLIKQNQLGGTDISLNVSGKGSLYYSWKATGISTTGAYTEEDQSVKVRRQFYNRSGAPLMVNNFSQNDLIIVAVTVENLFKGDVENMVITDILPACFEIENPRIRELPGMNWIKNAAVPTATDIRDDRIHLFMNLTQQKQTYYYAVRAVSPGTFRMGPVSVEAMYDGAIHSYNGGGLIRVGAE